VSFLIVIVVLILLMWVLMVRPQRRKQVQQKSMLDHLSDGDEILTAGGVYGTVRGVDGDEIRLEIAPGTQVRVAKRAIAAVIPPDEEEGEAEELEPADEEPVATGASDSDAQNRR